MTQPFAPVNTRVLNLACDRLGLVLDIVLPPRPPRVNGGNHRSSQSCARIHSMSGAAATFPAVFASSARSEARHT